MSLINKASTAASRALSSVYSSITNANKSPMSVVEDMVIAGVRWEDGADMVAPVKNGFVFYRVKDHSMSLDGAINMVKVRHPVVVTKSQYLSLKAASAKVAK